MERSQSATAGQLEDMKEPPNHTLQRTAAAILVSEGSLSRIAGTAAELCRLLQQVR